MTVTVTFATTVRIAALSFGGLLIVASMPLALMVASFPAEFPPPVSPLLLMPACACALASGFLYVGVAGRRMANSPWRRLLAGVLLAMPLVGGALMLIQPGQSHALALLLLLPAAALFACAVWPWPVRSMRA